MEECIFCKIIRGEAPSKKVYEDSKAVAFLDINPANLGQTLVVPKKHVKDIFEIEEELLADLIGVVGRLSKSMNKELKPLGINIVQSSGEYAGQLIDHFYFKIIPRFEGDKVLISYQPRKVTEQELDRVQNKIKITKTEEFDEKEAVEESGNEEPMEEETLGEEEPEEESKEGWELEF
jgi:histidine triad (HIT) family protein